MDATLTEAVEGSGSHRSWRQKKHNFASTRFHLARQRIIICVGS
jgi:hypothetical protein